MSGRRAPTYDLALLQDAIRQGAYWITHTAANGAARLHLDEFDILECIGNLTTASFYKTMPSKKLPGAHQDVYRCRHQGHPIYLKLQASNGGRAVVVSFKRDDRA